MRKIGRYGGFMVVTAGLIVLLHVICAVPGVADFYRRHIFWLWSATYGRLTGLAPFSVGGVLIVIGFFMAAVLALSLILLIPLHTSKRYITFFRKYIKISLAVTLCVLLLYTLNCSILFSCSRLAGGESTAGEERDYSVEELGALREYLIEQCNACGTFEKDASGVSTYGGDDLQEEVKKAMKNISDMFPELSGYYPDVKHFLSSDIMYYGNYIGMYYPFSMEANVTKYLSEPFYPSTVAHELAHLKGFVYEDEANFIAYLACVNSDQAFVRYSGYLSVLGYVEDDYYHALCKKYGVKKADGLFVPVSDRIDNYALDSCCYNKSAEGFRQLEAAEEGVAAEVFNTVEDNLMDGAYDFYESEVNYAEVTRLLLDYYDE